MTSLLRTADERIEFCDVYFESVGAIRLLERPMYREYRLPRDVDKELTDRPFFWLWAEKTNQEIKPTTLRLAFTEDAKRREDATLQAIFEKEIKEKPPQTRYDMMFRKAPQTELLDLGCFRLIKILESVQRRGFSAAVVPQNAHASGQYIPWLMVNGAIQYQADSIAEEWFSLGVCLENLQLIPDFFARIERNTMRPFSPQAILTRAKHTTAEVLDRFKCWAHDTVAERDHVWAEEAMNRLNDDLSQLDTYYFSIRDETAQDDSALLTEHARKRHELILKSTPQIHIKVTQIGLIGLPLRIAINK